MTDTAAHRLFRPPGITRDRGNRGDWSYTLADGTPVTDRKTLDRIRGLALPPAWTAVWITLSPDADIQATGVDARGRTQYRYSAAAQARHSADKFAHVLDLAAALPALRRDLELDLTQSGLGPDRVLAAAVRLLDRGFFRVGNQIYTRDNHTYGLTTLRRHHVTAGPGGWLHFDYIAKEHRHRVVDVHDPAAAAVVAGLLVRDDLSPASELLLAYQPSADLLGWQTVHSSHVNAYLHRHTHLPATAKAFRTWSGTVLAAAALGGADTSGLAITTSRDPIVAAYRATAALLGNTPAVARASYVHPDVVNAYLHGRTINHAVRAAAHTIGSDRLERIWVEPTLQDAVHALLVG